LKGRIGVVKDVFPRQKTASGLKISVQVEHYNPSCPYKTLDVDYDDIVEGNTGLPLFDYIEPRNVLFHPSKAYMKSACPPFRPPPHPPMLGVSTSGGATPMPDRTSSSTLAWDPLSHTLRTVDASSLTPAWNPPEDQSLPTNSRKQPDMPQHPFQDERLVGAFLKAVVNDGVTYKNREVAVSIAKVEGIVGIRHYVYNSFKGLAPAWVSPKIPNPTRDNGILMVVKGDHCGKYVRRIHHRYHEDKGQRQALILLAVVKKVDGAADMLTGEQLELGPDSLCVAVEMDEVKKLNANLMNSLRENARKRR